MDIRASDICLSIRSIREPADATAAGGGNQAFGTLSAALELVEQVRPSRIEWSYIKDRAQIAQLTRHGATFVAALNTIFPSGRAISFEGEPAIAPWMKGFGTPRDRKTYMCQNNPQDVQARIDQALELIADGVTDSFQFDDWYCNAQMSSDWFGSPCFCDYCQREFGLYLGLDLDYRRYLRGRGFTHTSGIFEAAKAGQVPLWYDYQRFQRETVTRFFRRLTLAMQRFLGGRRPILSVNGSVTGFGGEIELVRPFLTYLNGETPDFSDAALLTMAQRSRELGLRQVISFFPDVPAGQFHDAAFVARVNRGIALCYCLGLLPLFPYDVWAGPDKPRWFGTWDEYAANYQIVRSHPAWVDDYAFDQVELGPDAATIIARRADGSGKGLRHVVDGAGQWTTTEI